MSPELKQKILAELRKAGETFRKNGYSEDVLTVIIPPEMVDEYEAIRDLCEAAAGFKVEYVTEAGLNAACKTGDLKPCEPFGNPEQLMSALYDVRDKWIARLPKSEWYRDKKAQGVEQGIEMCIKRLGEVLYGKK